ncbi:GNAT family N-acetyltransferase [Sansalvadorimonas sp. 2012CJ34-2]|uniref:GNAT family N-acetyltransferase n=1 Tax=Parendozoicomonas callyspongiae TaxID=2942213 RepID=A0ABT0PLR4_9GAMM|nr:GNAT family N-acetyltransferase [Sansalvadorimonas sp. 2012CJ34-2]MCL6272330.1 GNAT family N-acetyltransferase [Sansalvadorimonas sp. 2012CJ34-2]
MEAIGKNLSPLIFPEKINKEIIALGYKVRVRTDVKSELYKDFYDFACHPEEYEAVESPPENNQGYEPKNRNCTPFIVEFLSDDSQNLVGCVASTFYHSENTDDQVLEVDFLAITPKKQRKGLGTLLMNYVIEIMKKQPVKKIILEPKDVSEQFYTKKLKMRRVVLPNTDIQMELLLKS